MLEPAFYQGTLFHQRVLPRKHQFAYNISMCWIDLDQAESFFNELPWLAYRRFHIASFFPEDYLGRKKNLKAEVLDTIKKKTGSSFAGRIFLLTQIRRFGFVFNPVSFYFCYDDDGLLRFIVAEIENTPWGERFAYVLRTEGDKQEFRFAKSFHVSPFMPMDMNYQWEFVVKNDRLLINMDCEREGKPWFRSVLNMQRQPATTENARRFVVGGLAMTFKVMLYIYWHALRLWLKRVPFYAHPNPATRKGW